MPTGVAVLGMAGGLAAELAELLQIIDGQAVAEQVQQGIDQHRAVARGQHEAVAVDPLGIGGVVLHLLAPDGVGRGRRAHGHARMAGLGLLDALCGQYADGIHDQVGMGAPDLVDAVDGQRADGVDDVFIAHGYALLSEINIGFFSDMSGIYRFRFYYNTQTPARTTP